MQDREVTFLKPLWRRVTLVFFCAAWALGEFYNQELYWAAIVGAITAYAVWTYLIDFDRKPAAQVNADTKEQP